MTNILYVIIKTKITIRRQIMKKITNVFVLLFVVAILTACTPPDDIIITDREEYIEANATQINMWCADFEEWQNQLNIKQRMDFNDIKDDGLQLTQTFIQQNDLDDRLRSARETGSTPDIYMISIGNLYKEVKNGYAADISSLFTTWDDLIPSAIEGVTYNHKQYGYPICLEPSSLLFYRKDLLEEYGNTLVPPKTWDEFLELCSTIKANLKKANKKGCYPFDVPKGVDCAWGTWGTQYAASNGLAITEDWSSSRLLTDGKEGYLALGNLWEQLFLNNYVPLSSGPYNEYINDLALGKLVMCMAGSWSVSEIINTYADLKDKIGVAPMPTFDGNQNKTTATNGGWVYVISEASAHKNEAADVLKFLVAGDDTTRVEEYYKKAYYSKSSPRKSVQDKIEESLKTQNEVPTEWVQTINSVTKNACLEPIYNWDISIEIELYLEKCAMGDGVEDSLIKADKAIKEIISRTNMANTNPRR